MFVCSECSRPATGRSDTVTCSKACRDRRYRRLRDARIRREAVAEYREKAGRAVMASRISDATTKVFVAPKSQVPIP